MNYKQAKQLQAIKEAIRVSKEYFLDHFAKMICGDEPYDYFTYRSSSKLTRFFQELDLPYTHDGSTRRLWVKSILEDINNNSYGIKHFLRIYLALFDESFLKKINQNPILDKEKARNAFRELIRFSIKESTIPKFSDSLFTDIHCIQHNINDRYCEELLKNAKTKFDNHLKKDAINDLWDIFERLKTYVCENKKTSTKIIIEYISDYSNIEINDIDEKFKRLTEFGNKYNIRHYERNKIILNEEAYFFVFYEMLNFLNLIIEALKNSDINKL
ncbi:hypothetical protein [Francisella sp. TX07-6608]|uniref:hypothetical protein n=1 Tax=Francisella sp. TX07-6608 TaxID=573568 RepID=UPI0008F9A38A|nr:hypothetical protein [Francisella sp. TX07-6608]